MALRKPIVLNAGQFEELQSGDTLDASTSDKEVVSLTNNNGSTVSKGDLGYIDAADGFDLADASAAGTADAICVVSDATIATATAGNVQLDGILTGLSLTTAGAIQYLDTATPGGIVESPPTGAGNFIKQIGTAFSTTDLMIQFERRIKLG